jgi:hypothetical protein
LGKLIIIRELWGAQLPGLCGAPGWWWRLLRALVQSGGACEAPRFIGRRGDGSVLFVHLLKNFGVFVFAEEKIGIILRCNGEQKLSVPG